MASLWGWFWQTLASWGLVGKRGKIVFIGLDNAGKTTLLHLLRDDRVSAHMPTQKPTMEELCIGHLRFQTFDLGGHAIARRLWSEYCGDADGLVYLVDASDRARFADAQRELADLLETTTTEKAAPLLVLCNKIDLPGAASEYEMRAALGLTNGHAADDQRPVEVFMCSVIRRQGYKEGFQWLAQFF